MSTTYQAVGYTFQDALKAARPAWRSTYVQVMGRRRALTDGRSYAHDLVELALPGGTPVFEFTRYGANDLSDLVDRLSAVSEHDPDFWWGEDVEEPE